MNLEEHLSSRTPITAPRNLCDCCRRTLNLGEGGTFCGDCRERFGVYVLSNRFREGLSTPIGELPPCEAVPDYAGEIVDASLPAATLSQLAAEHPPPQSWYDDTGNPMERPKLDDAQLDALAELIRKT